MESLLRASSLRERSWAEFCVTVVLVTVLLLPGPVEGEVTCPWEYAVSAKPAEMQATNGRTAQRSLM
jgi:hypothetical protein